MRELGHDVAAAVAHDRLQQACRERLEVRAHRVDPRLREQRVDERAVDAVLGWVELERQQRVLARLRGRDERRPGDRRRERLAVERGGGDVVVAVRTQNPPYRSECTSGCSSRIGPKTRSGSSMKRGSCWSKLMRRRAASCDHGRRTWRGGGARRSSRAPRSDAGIVLPREPHPRASELARCQERACRSTDPSGHAVPHTSSRPAAQRVEWTSEGKR